MSAKFVISKSKNDKFLFNLKAGNGEVILSSEMYEAKTSALAGIDSVKANASLDDRYERTVPNLGQIGRNESGRKKVRRPVAGNDS